ncbi:MAG: patatin-like phospholipase family protein [Syntrophaceae bacterium]
MKIRIVLIVSAVLFLICSCTPKAVPPVVPAKPAKIALVLGAGASKGFAHVGVIKVLEANRVPIHMIVGTSAGSFVGSLYAYGYNSFQLQEIAFQLDKSHVADFIIPDSGFLKGEKLENYVNFMLGNTPMEKLKIPFYAVATDIRTGGEVVFGTGNTGTAVRASCSIPGVFKPVVLGNNMYVDGGVVSPVAVNAARRYGADVVIAVDISAGLQPSLPQGLMATILQAIDIMYSRISALQTPTADIVIKPKVSAIGSADFDRRHEAILEGEKAALIAMPAIQGVLKKLRDENRL